jgi:polar amino acid transport system substrate-binding protein
MWEQSVYSEGTIRNMICGLAPTGRLRVAINFGNAVLAQRDNLTGSPVGVAVDIAHELACRLGVELQLVHFESAGSVVEAAQNNVWDLAFLARDPVRADVIDFTAPYVIIEGSYLVPCNAPLTTNEDLDTPGVRIAVGKGAAYDLYLTRTLKHAELVRAPTTPGAVDLFIDQKLNAVAGVRMPLLRYAAEHPEYRVIDGRFMAIEQALAVPKGNIAALGFLSNFIETLKADDYIAEALEKSGQRAVVVAPVTSD